MFNVCVYLVCIHTHQLCTHIQNSVGFVCVECVCVNVYMYTHMLTTYTHTTKTKQCWVQMVRCICVYS
jgi:hypothetical protein